MPAPMTFAFFQCAICVAGPADRAQGTRDQHGLSRLDIGRIDQALTTQTDGNADGGRFFH